jgi:hypothetical protein
VVTVVFVIHLAYTRGALNLSYWYYTYSSQMAWRWSSQMVSINRGLAASGVAWTGIGAVLMTAMVLAQRSFFWWPLHPIALLVCNTQVQGAWLSLFLAWSAKLLVVRLGGYRAYRAARKLCIGLALGCFMAGGIWAVIDTFTGMTNTRVFYM